VPDIMPVLESRVIPAGKVPALILNVSVPVPVAVIITEYA